jgi:hypothetical protein
MLLICGHERTFKTRKEQTPTMTNCFRMMATGILLEGIPVIGNGKRCVQLGDREDVRVIPFHAQPPLVRDELLREAAPDKTNPKRPLLRSKGRWGGVLIMVTTRILRFPETTSTHLPCIMNAWAGIEQAEYPFAQSGTRYLLVAIEDGEICFACDTTKRYVQLFCNNGRIEISAADPQKLAGCLVERARRRGNAHAGLTWTLRTLENLGYGNLWPDDLRKRLAAMDTCRY